MRNRIMAGLSHAILIIEGEHDSGTLITARLGLEYDREVLAVPGSIFSPTSEGPLALIRNGATPICTPEDLLVALGLKEAGLLRDSDEMQHLLQKCSPEELEVLVHLNNPRSREELLSLVSFDLSKLQVILSLLEIRMLTEERFGKIYKTYVQKES
jgi:DNA processing protein